MDVTLLARRYGDLIEVSRCSSFAAPLGGWTARMVVAHLALNDRLLIGAVATGEFDNTAATDRAHLQAHPDPLTALEASSAEVLDLLAGLSADQAAAPVSVRIAEVGDAAVDQPMRLAEVVDLHTRHHLPGHLEQLLALRVLPWGASVSVRRGLAVPENEWPDLLAPDLAG